MTTIAAEGRRLSLFGGESRLAVAFEALLAADPECSMTADEAESFLATFVNRDAVISRRDDLGDFLDAVHHLIEAKTAQSAKLAGEANALAEGYFRMKASVVRTMEGLGVDELRGVHRILRIVRSRGSVEITDEKKIPAQFWRVRRDDDLQAIEDLVAIVRDLARGSVGAIRTGDAKQAATDILREAQERRRAVDKKAIQDAWRLAGGATVSVPKPVAFPADWASRPDPPETVFERIDTIEEPVVPGAARKVETRLDVK